MARGAVLYCRPACTTALGAAVLPLLFGNAFALGENLPAGPILQSLFMQVLLTAILMPVIVPVATDRRANGLPAGLAFSGAVALNVLWAGPVSGASMNPARSFGPVLISG
ncbi:MAG: aquaporin, partial [Caldilineaceae bacterium]|nr:aquaporin [Caldilineaceae bacterium]